MNKTWLKQLASDVEARHGKDVSDRIFGDIDISEDCKSSISHWFDNFTMGMDELNDKEFLQQMMANRCPCGGDNAKDGQIIKELYDKSEPLDEFVDLFDKWQRSIWKGVEDITELRGNVLYLTKRPMSSSDSGKCGVGCHCDLARQTDKYISDIYCYCCTVGHTGRPFRHAFGDKIIIQFVDSIVTGDKGCTMAVHLPEKDSVA